MELVAWIIMAVVVWEAAQGTVVPSPPRNSTAKAEIMSSCTEKNGLYLTTTNTCYMYKATKGTFAIVNTACRTLAPPSRHYHSGTIVRVSVKAEVDAIDAVRVWLEKNYNKDVFLDMKRCVPVTSAEIRNAESGEKDILRTSDWCLSDASGNVDTKSPIQHEINSTASGYKIHMLESKDNCVVMDVSSVPTKLKNAECDREEYTACQFAYDECASNPCQNGATCTDGLDDYECTCAPGFTDVICSTNINECASNPCQNGATCVDKVDGYTCNCVPGYTDRLCGTNINECASNPCQNGATCNDLINMYTCTCVPGYTDLHCSTNIDECKSSPCQHGGTCTDKVNMYVCTCVPGYTDAECQTNIDECASTPCQNGATCVDLINKYTCTCVAGYTDVWCATNINECVSSPCVNGGTCVDGVNGYKCACHNEITSGLHCQTTFTSRFGHDASCDAKMSDCKNYYSSLAEPKDQNACACECTKTASCKGVVYSEPNKECGLLKYTFWDIQREDNYSYIYELRYRKALETKSTYYENIKCPAI